MSFESPIFVAGTARSGTSLFAGILKICGAWLGETEPGGEGVNPDGFFENKAIRDGVVKQIMNDHDCDPLGVQKIPDIRKLKASLNLDEIIRALITQQGYEDGQWAYKDAKLSLLWPIFLNKFPKARWIVVRRNTDDIVDSCMRTWFMKAHCQDPGFWKIWVDAYVARTELLKTKTALVREIWPEEFIQGDRKELKQVIEWLGLEYKPAEIDKFINKGYWHCKQKAI